MCSTSARFLPVVLSLHLSQVHDDTSHPALIDDGWPLRVCLLPTYRQCQQSDPIAINLKFNLHLKNKQTNKLTWCWVLLSRHLRKAVWPSPTVTFVSNAPVKTASASASLRLSASVWVLPSWLWSTSSWCCWSIPIVLMGCCCGDRGLFWPSSKSGNEWWLAIRLLETSASSRSSG